MHSESRVSPPDETLDPDCVFCQRDTIADYILKETPTLRLLADHAPLVPGHMLIVSRSHYACYGAVPATLDQELCALKQEVQRFFVRYYEPSVFWEHGVYHQTVFHAHLHSFPVSTIHYDPTSNLHASVVSAQEDIRTWYTTHGPYFYLEETHSAFLFAPELASYLAIIQKLWQAAIAHNKQTARLPPLLRRKLSGPFIQDLQAKWLLFQEEEKNYVDTTGA
jgi:diadenosine tetraphosphate (Ap4A) HIT family hydrolase